MEWVLNGILAGLVASTSMAAVVKTWASLPVGLVACILLFATTWLLTRLKIDDPVGAVAAHGAPGIWSMVATALFYDEGLLAELYGGWLPRSRWHLLGAQLAALVCITGWVLMWSCCSFFLLRLAFGGSLNMDNADDAHLNMGNKPRRRDYPQGEVTTVIAAVQHYNKLIEVDSYTTQQCAELMVDMFRWIHPLPAAGLLCCAYTYMSCLLVPFVWALRLNDRCLFDSVSRPGSCVHRHTQESGRWNWSGGEIGDR